MSRTKKCLLMLFAFLGVVCIITSCANIRGVTDDTQSNGGYQDAELMQKIVKDYEEYCSEQWNYNPLIHGKCRVDYCYGVYNNCVPIMMEIVGTSTSCEESKIEIGTVIIHYRNGNDIEIWREGEFYSLSKAYKEGWITEENLQEIAEIHDERYIK